MHTKDHTYKTLSKIDEIERLFLSHAEKINLLDNFSIFMTADFILAWLSHYSLCVHSIQFIVFYTNNEITGLAPLYIRRGDSAELRFICTGENEEDEVFSERLDFLVANGCENRVALSFMQYLNDTKRKWSKVVIDNYMQNSFIAKHLIPALHQNHCSLLIKSEGLRYVLTLADTMDDFYRDKKGSFYNGLKRKSRHLMKLEGFSAFIVSNVNEIDPYMGDIKYLHNNRWNNSDIRGAFESDVFFEFHKDIARRLLIKQRLFLLIIKVDELVVSVVYGFIFKGVLSFYQSGYVIDEYKNLSIGSSSHLIAIEMAISKNITLYDFMFGSENSYKRKFKCDTEEMYRCEIYKPGLSGRLKKFLKKLSLVSTTN